MNPLKRLWAKLAVRTKQRDRSRKEYRRTGKGGLELRRHQKAVLKLRFLIRRMKTPRSITAKGAAFIATFEGFCPKPVDIGDGVTTIAIGIVLHKGPPTAADRRGIWIEGQKTPGQVTYKEALRMFERELAKNYEPPVRALFAKGGPLHGKFTTWRNDGLISPAFNLGPGSVTPGTTGFETLGRAIDNADFHAIAEALPLYRNPGTQFEEGLERRRRCEGRLILTANYSTEI